MNKQEWDNSLLEHFAPKKGGLNLVLLMEMVAEVMDTLETEPVSEACAKEVLQEDAMAFTLSMIPDIDISEIGWATMETRDGKPITTDSRAQLEQFLSQIEGAEIQAKIVSLNNFYKMDQETAAKMSTNSIGENIALVLSYLVFFKTLTKILTHFNASSAGFSFEAFLGVLLGGQQVPANTGTIADLYDATGVPISLKLYKEGKLEVGGSFSALALDLLNDSFKNTMQYICVTKDIGGEKDEETGARAAARTPMEQEGTLHWYRFNFNLDNIFNILANSSIESQKCILLPKPFLESRGESVEGVPEKAQGLPDAEEMENEFNEILFRTIEESREAVLAELPDFKFETLKQAIDYAKRDELFLPVSVGDEKKVVRGKSGFRLAALQTVLRGSVFADSEISVKTSAIYKIIVWAHIELLNRYKGDPLKKARAAKLSELYFYDGLGVKELVERSRAFYQDNPELRKRCLEYSYGYISTAHFNLTQKMIQNIATIAQPSPGQLFLEGQSDVGIGTIEIGGKNVQQVLDKLVGMLNENIFEIFGNLKSLTTNIQSYFAGGMKEKDEGLAKDAITSSRDIDKKTTELSGVEV